MKTSLVDRTPGAGRQANFSAGMASAKATSCRETWTHSPSYPCHRPSRGSSWACKVIAPKIIARSSVFMFPPLHGDYHEGKHGSVKLQFTADEAIHPDAGLQRAYRCGALHLARPHRAPDRKSTRLNSSHLGISYAVFCLKKKKNT